MYLLILEGIKINRELYKCAESIVQSWFLNIRSQKFWQALGIKPYSKNLIETLFTSPKTRKLHYIINLEYLAALTSATIKHKQRITEDCRINWAEVRDIIIKRGIYLNEYCCDMGLNKFEAAKEYAASVEYYNNSFVSRYIINDRILSKITYNEDVVEGCATMLELYIIQQAFPESIRE